MMDTPTRITTLADAFLAAPVNAGLARRTLSRRLFDNGARLDALANGGDLTTRTADAAFAWFAANWPAGIPFPPGGFAPSPPQPAAGVASPDAAGGLSVSDEVAE